MLEYPMKDTGGNVVFTSLAWHFIPASGGKNKLVIVHQGHDNTLIDRVSRRGRGRTGRTRPGGDHRRAVVRRVLGARDVHASVPPGRPRHTEPRVPDERRAAARRRVRNALLHGAGPGFPQLPGDQLGQRRVSTVHRLPHDRRRGRRVDDHRLRRHRPDHRAQLPGRGIDPALSPLSHRRRRDLQPRRRAVPGERHLSPRRISGSLHPGRDGDQLERVPATPDADPRSGTTAASGRRSRRPRSAPGTCPSTSTSWRCATPSSRSGRAGCSASRSTRPTSPPTANSTWSATGRSSGRSWASSTTRDG